MGTIRHARSQRLAQASCILLAAILAACGREGGAIGPFAPPPPTATPTPEPASIHVLISEEERFYLVGGEITATILESVLVNGPTHTDGRQASGVTESTWQLNWELGRLSGVCRISEMWINLDMVVVLPRHVDEGSLEAELAGNFRRFVEAVREHELEHVVIERERADRTRAAMEELAGEAMDCAALEQAVERAWDTESARADRLHERFDVADRARIERLRAPVAGAIAGLGEEIDSLDRELGEIGDEIARIDVELADIEQRYPDLILPEPHYSRYARLVEQRNALAGRYNAAVDERNALVAQKNALVDEHNWIH